MRVTQKRTYPRGLTAPPKRAVIGGSLIAFAALGVFSAHRSTISAPSQKFVVASHAIPAGTTITRSDLGLIALDLPESLNVISEGDASRLIGRVTSADLDELTLITKGDLYTPDQLQQLGGVRLALDLPPARAMAGVVSTGDVVSVLSTDPQGSGTELITDNALILEIQSGSDKAIGTSSSVRVILSVPTSTIATEITDAAIRAELTLVVPDADSEVTAEEPSDLGDQGSAVSPNGQP